MAHDRINSSTERRFRDGQTRYSKKKARPPKAKIRVPGDGTPLEVHRKELRLAHKEYPCVPRVTPQNSHRIGSGTAHTIFTVTVTRNNVKRTNGHVDSNRMNIINGDRLGKNPMGIPREK